VEDLAGLILGMRQQFFELGDILPGLGQVERSEILIEVVIDEILYRVEGTLSMLK
jgi:hypothetical protein